MKKIMEHIGENYYYADQIVENKFKLFKLGMIENTSKLVSLSVLGALLMVIFLMIMGCVSFAGIYFLADYLNSMGVAIIAVKLLLISAASIIYYLRKKLIYKPIQEFVFHELYQNKK